MCGRWPGNRGQGINYSYCYTLYTLTQKQCTHHIHVWTSPVPDEKNYACLATMFAVVGLFHVDRSLNVACADYTYKFTLYNAFNYHQIASAQALGPLELYQFSWLHSNNIANICKTQGSSTKFWQQTCQKNTCPNVYLANKCYSRALASSPGHSQILSRSHGEISGEGCSCEIKSGSGLGTRLL